MSILDAVYTAEEDDLPSFTNTKATSTHIDINDNNHNIQSSHSNNINLHIIPYTEPTKDERVQELAQRMEMNTNDIIHDNEHIVTATTIIDNNTIIQDKPHVDTNMINTDGWMKKGRYQVKKQKYKQQQQQQQNEDDEQTAPITRHPHAPTKLTYR